jgi:hypothetical protein
VGIEGFDFQKLRPKLKFAGNSLYFLKTIKFLIPVLINIILNAYTRFLEQSRLSMKTKKRRFIFPQP